MKVPLIDLQAQYLSLKPDIDAAVLRVLGSGKYVGGEEVEAFEEEWAAYCGAKYCVGVSSGSDAIYLVYRAIEQFYGVVTAGTGNKSQDTGRVVLVPAFTFIGTVEPLLRAGMKVEFVDVDIDTGLMSYSVKAEADERSILPVHLYGRPFRPDHSLRPLMMVEDAAQGHGIKLTGVAACYSFYPTKNLGCAGQGGAVVTNNEKLANLIRQLRNHGEGPNRFEHIYLSGNYRLDPIQAAILRVKLPYLDGWNKRRREIAAIYNRELKDLLLIYLSPDDPEHVYHIYAIRCEKRSSLAKFLEEMGIQTSVRYPVPLHFQPALVGSQNKSCFFPFAERWADTVLTLPIYPEMTDQMVNYVVEAIQLWPEIRNRV